MIITIDCRMLYASGIGVYLRGILQFLLKTEHSFILIGNTGQLSFYESNKNVTIIDCEIKPFSIKELLFFPKKIIEKINKADFYFSPFFNIPYGITIPIYTTIHDIIFPDIPELTSKPGLAVRMWFFRRAYKKSKKIFTVSEYSKSRIKHHLGAEKPVIVTHSAVQRIFFEYRLKTRGIQKKETIIFIGNIKKHKGLDCLLDAFMEAKKEGLPHKLIIIGSKENFRTKDNIVMQKVSSLGSDTVLFTGSISDDQLMEYLSQASLLIQPSLYEGFGLPPLEAMVLGTSALISDIPVFKEIYADYPVVFFQAGNSNDLKEKMIELLNKKNELNVYLPENLLSKYSFQKTASTILENIA